MKWIKNFFIFILEIIVWVVALVIYLPFCLLFPIRVYGKENLTKQKGGAIVASNHFSNLDVIFLDLHFFKIPFRRKLLAKKELAKFKPFGFMLLAFGAIFINRGKVDLPAVREVDKSLKSGKKVIIFPEGTRNKTGSTDMQEIKSGVVFFAKKSGAPIIPLRMEQKARLFRINRVYIGKPYFIGEDGKLSTEEEVLKLEQKFDELIKH